MSRMIKQTWTSPSDNQYAPVLHWTIRASDNKRKVDIEIILTPDGTNS